MWNIQYIEKHMPSLCKLIQYAAVACSGFSIMHIVYTAIFALLSSHEGLLYCAVLHNVYWECILLLAEVVTVTLQHTEHYRCLI